MRAIIVGAGIGGLSAALCLRRIGWQVCVLEQTDQLGEIGAGIQISPNASRLLGTLGVLDRVGPAAFEPERIEMRLGRSGREVFSIPLREAAMARWGAPYLHLHRADLLAALIGVLCEDSPDAVLTGKTVIGYTQEKQKIQADLADGSSVEADILIGADGIHSTIRDQMLGKQPPRFTGNVAWRATVPISSLGELAPPPTACVWVGPGRHAVTYRLRGGALINFVGVVEQQGWETESWTEQGRCEDVLADFSGWHPIITNLIRQADSHYRWALFDRAPLKQWTDGRAALIGDACHPMLPFLAQGAAMAIEDAWVLAESLKASTQPSQALQAYAAARLDRTRKVQAGSLANMRTFHHKHDLAYLPLWLIGKLMPGFIHSRQDWIYGLDLNQSANPQHG